MPQTSKVATFPAPVKGWNTSLAQFGKDKYTASTLINFLPFFGEVPIRKGCISFCTGLGGSVETLATFNAADGTKQLIAAANGSLQNITSGTAVSMGSGFSINRWQWINFRGLGSGRALFYNGTDQPKQWDGTTLSDAVYTGISTDNDIQNVSSYKSRLYLLPKNSTSVWYGGVNNITGALTEFDVGPLLRKGGNLVYAGSWSTDLGVGLQDLFVLISSEGECLMYDGSDPSSWSLAARLELPKPIGLRCAANVGADLWVLTVDGVASMVKTMTSDGSKGKFEAITKPIQEAYRQFVSLYKSVSGWQIIEYPEAGLVLINIPESSSYAFQIAMNTNEGTFGLFKGQNATCWCVHDGNLYYGDNQGNVFKAWSGYSDNGTAINWEIKTVFHLIPPVGVQKQTHMAKPLIRSTSTLQGYFNTEVDFQDSAVLDSITPTSISTGGEWDSGEWDDAEWGDANQYLNEWFNVTGMGDVVAFRARGNSKDIEFAFSAFTLVYEVGGIL